MPQEEITVMSAFEHGVEENRAGAREFSPCRRLYHRESLTQIIRRSANGGKDSAGMEVLLVLMFFQSDTPFRYIFRTH